MFEQELVVDLIHTVVEIGEITKIGFQLGYDVHVEPAWDEQREISGHQVRFTWREGQSDWGTTQLVNMAMLTAYVQGWSGDKLLDTMRAKMIDRCFSMDKPLQDVMSIGAGHEGHDHG